MSRKTKHVRMHGRTGSPEWFGSLDDGIYCDGTLTYDEGAEGNFCNKCQYYDGVK